MCCMGMDLLLHEEGVEVVEEGKGGGDAQLRPASLLPHLSPSNLLSLQSFTLCHYILEQTNLWPF